MEWQLRLADLRYREFLADLLQLALVNDNEESLQQESVENCSAFFALD